MGEFTLKKSERFVLMIERGFTVDIKTDYLTDLHNLKYNACFIKQSPVKQYDKNGNFIRRYNSITEAVSETGICGTTISRCCQRKGKTAGGYKWLYADI